MSETTFGNYVLGLAGLGLLQRWYSDEGPDHRDRLIATAADYDNSGVLKFSFPTPELDAKHGYTLWSGTYDGENPMIAAEEVVMRPRFGDLFASGKVALDAGCGTGRHAATLAEIGYGVIGTDLTPAMLDIARAKVPSADFREGVFEDLPVADNAVDLVTSALAVCHATDLTTVFREFARVLRPGGNVIVSDPHPTSAILGAQAFFPGEGVDLPFVRNRAHSISEYVSAMIAAGFRIDALTELPYDEAVLETNPLHQMYPKILADGLKGLPFVLIVEATLMPG